MKLSTNMIVQVIATAMQILNASGGLLPPKYFGLVAGVLGALQTGVAAVAHFQNPDGTSVKVAYIPPKKG